jgi:hypothetical protein
MSVHCVHRPTERNEADGLRYTRDTRSQNADGMGMRKHVPGHHMAYPCGDRDWSLPVTTDRNYARFAALAGVRGEGLEPRGIPDDASETTKYLVELWGSDGHSHSWLPAEEAAEIFLATDHAQTPGEYKTKFPASYFLGVEGTAEHRLIFWFDN